MRTDLHHFSKASADHAPLFTDGHRISLAIVAAFAIGAVFLSFLFVGLPDSERQAKRAQESVHVARR